jgi:RND superfamily putative drug exporter
MSARRNLAAGAARWSVRHRRKAILGWLAFVIAAVAIGGALGTRQLTLSESNVGEAGRADATLSDAGFAQPARERVLVQSADPGALRAAAADVRERLDGVAVNVQPAATKPGAALIAFDVPGEIDTATERVGAAEAAVAAAQRAHPGARISQAGDASIQKAIDDRIGKDFQKAELSALPITLVILAVAFGAIVAALVPLLLGISAVVAALGLIALPSQVVAVHESIYTVALLIGLAVGVDYALFYLRREREERAAGREPEAAILAAAATSGRAVLVSGLTVIGAVAGMLVTENPWYRSYALAIILVVATAMAASVTVLPAVLSWLGDRVDRGRLPRVRLRTRRPGRIVDAVLRRPLVSAVAATALLLALAAPVLGLDLAEQGLGSMPADLPARQSAERIQEAFPGGAQPATVVATGDDLAPGIERLRDALAGDAQFGAPVQVDQGDGVARISVPLAGSGVDEQSHDALEALRDEVLPATGLDADVGGPTAQSADFRAETLSQGPWIVGLVLALSFGLLLVTFRSIVVPLKAIALNLLSVLASWGVLVLVFQEGVGASVLGFEPTGSVSTWIPLLTFLLLFGLSMDYHVFILSRIREAVDDGMTTADAVRHALRATAGTVTSAAMVMVGVFAIFASLSLVDIKQVGVGLAVAVLIDATIVRAVLLPAAMVLLGERNWWLPRPLRRWARPLPAT